MDKEFDEVMVWVKDPKKGTFSLYNFTHLNLVGTFHYNKDFDISRRYLYTSLYKGERLVIVDPHHSKYITLYDFYNRTINRLVFQNLSKYKKIRVRKIKKFLNFDKFWVQLYKDSII